MRLAIIYQFFQGEDEPGHSLTYNMSKRLTEKGDDVTVYCGETGYMRSLASKRPFWKRFIQREKMGSINLVRTYSYVGLHRGYLGRLLNFATFCASSALALLFSQKPDVALISSPPLFSSFSSSIICWLRRIPYVIEVRDLWPDSLVQMDVLHNPLLIKLMYGMERFIYNHAQGIIVLTKGIQNDLIKRGWNADKISFIHCGVDFDKLYPDPEAGLELRRTHGWESKRVVMYFGALGEANNLDVILLAASLLKERDDIAFALVGDGIRKNKLQETATELGLKNLHILPAVSKNLARSYLNAADICAVTLLDIPIFAGAIPTKLIDYMSCGKPVLCGVLGEAKQIVDKSECGYTFSPNDHENLASLIVKLADNEKECKSMGNKGYDHAKQYYSIETMLSRVEQALSNAVTESSQAEPRKAA